MVWASLALAWAGPLVGVVKDPNGKPVRDALVYATPLSGGRPAAGRARRAVIDQIDKEFVPHVKPVQVGTQVSFPNKDDIRHHVYSFSPSKTFELPLYTGTPAAPVTFDRPGVVVLGCNIHDWMLGYVFVLETPHFDATGDDGTARLRSLPAGGWDVRVWHPQMRESPESTGQRVSIGDDAEVRVAFTISLKPQWRPRRPPGGVGERYR
jgi:plastocyanin